MVKLGSRTPGLFQCKAKLYVIVFTILALSTLGHCINAVIETVADDISQEGEGPFWDSDTSILYFVDTIKGEFKRLDPKSRKVTKISQGVQVSTIIPYADEPNTFVVSRRHELLKLNWTTRKVTVLATVNPDLKGLEKFNDAKCDPRGRLFIGTILEKKVGDVVPKGGALYRLDGKKLVKVAKGFSITNGMAWSNDDSKFYLNDSEGRKIYKFDYNIEDGTLKNQKVMINCDESSDFVADEYPDGMLMDNQGFIWVAMYNGGRIVKIDPKVGRVVDEIKLPKAKIPSSLAPGIFKGNQGFYVTTVSSEVPKNKRQDDGKVLHITLKNSGKVYKFKP